MEDIILHRPQRTLTQYKRYRGKLLCFWDHCLLQITSMSVAECKNRPIPNRQELLCWVKNSLLHVSVLQPGGCWVRNSLLYKQICCFDHS